MEHQTPENVPVPVQILLQPICVSIILRWALPSCHKSHFSHAFRAAPIPLRRTGRRVLM